MSIDLERRYFILFLSRIILKESILVEIFSEDVVCCVMIRNLVIKWNCIFLPLLSREELGGS